MFFYIAEYTILRFANGGVLERVFRNTGILDLRI